MSKKNEKKGGRKAAAPIVATSALPITRAAWRALRGEDSRIGNADASKNDAITSLGIRQVAAAPGSSQLTAALLAADVFTRTLTGLDPNLRAMAGTQFAKDRPKRPYAMGRAVESVGLAVGGKVAHKVAQKTRVNKHLKAAQKALLGRAYVEV